MKHTWQLIYQLKHQGLNEPSLSLKHQTKGSILRCWIGPMAEILMSQAIQLLKYHVTKTKPIIVLNISKQFAQHFLIEASLQQQLQLQRFYVVTDIQNKQGIQRQADELLLFIRMSCQHPCHQTLLHAMACMQPDNHRSEELIWQLQQQQLIQVIEHQNTRFYDKNPIPHRHLYDPKKHVIFDYNSHINSSGYQLI